MNLYNTLEQQLKKEPNFVTDNGELKKWVVLNKAQNFDEELIGLLLKEPTLKEKFFRTLSLSKGETVTVFNQNLFVQFLEQKNYLNDSYTQYKNKVGLTIDGKYLKQRNEVALVWPFKDCILEGGQSREEDKREEIFFNEILAQDEITQLLEPKVLTNAKRYDKDGEHSFDGFNRNEKGTITDNLIIKGNNLLALHTLKEEFAGKVKLIYIDPPYNTGGEAETFTYNNSFNHSTFYTFLKNRLQIAKTFLRDDGFICIAIDHYELYYLGVIADEIFGRENKIGIVTVVHKPEGRNQEKFFGTSNEFMLVYSKNKDNAEFQDVILDKELAERYDKEDGDGKYRLKNFIRLTDGKYSLRESKPHFYYPIYVSDSLDKFSIEPVENYKPVYPITDKGVERTWKTTEKTFLRLVNENKIVAEKSEDGNIVLFEKLREKQVIKTHWIKKEYHAYHFGTKLLENTLGRKAFSFPKSLYTVFDTLKIMTEPEDIIMDFHSGSGTTAHAVIELNKEDDGNRQFILVEQLNEHIDICNERIQKVLIKENSNTNFTYLELKKYNQTFMEQIASASSATQLLEIWEQMKAKSFLNYNVDIKKHDAHIEEFKNLSLARQKRHLCELLDKNQLYVNLSSLNDADFACSEEEKRLNHDFYKMKR
ncbi:MAG: site-specific DNA-methyltransferase [Flavobacteriales bacterium]|nr:site-specific DNA-methyltransferase [Flavobacteriales bacterium]